MPVLFRREVPLRTIVAVEPQQARALQAPLRLAMLDLLAQRPMSIEQLAEELPAHGFRKAHNTLRHHLDILVRAGLVELSVLEQTRGAVLKYYAAASRPLHFQLPESTQADVQVLAAKISEQTGGAVEQLLRTEADRIARVARSVPSCPRCSREHLEEFVLLSAMHVAAVDLLRQWKSAPGRSAEPRPRPPRPRRRPAP
jgi:DNA-binding transcriptional ArsR family regulator